MIVTAVSTCLYLRNKVRLCSMNGHIHAMTEYCSTSLRVLANSLRVVSAMTGNQQPFLYNFKGKKGVLYQIISFMENLYQREGVHCIIYGTSACQSEFAASTYVVSLSLSDVTPATYKKTINNSSSTGKNCIIFSPNCPSPHL